MKGSPRNLCRQWIHSGKGFDNMTEVESMMFTETFILNK